MNTNEMSNKYFLPVAVVVAGLLIAGAVVWGGPRQAGPGVASSVNIENIKTDGNPFIGQKDAPVAIAIWTDFQCPFCRAVEVGGIPQIPTLPALPEIIKNYVETGKAKIVFMDFVFLGNDSADAALYGRSIWKLYPDKYFEWRTAMFEAQDEEQDTGFGDSASIDTLNATITGIDVAKVSADVKANAGTYKTAIDASMAEGRKIGINSTPSFVIGTELIAGAYPYEKFQATIDALLK